MTNLSVDSQSLDWDLNYKLPKMKQTRYLLDYTKLGWRTLRWNFNKLTAGLCGLFITNSLFGTNNELLKIRY